MPLTRWRNFKSLSMKIKLIMIWIFVLVASVILIYNSYIKLSSNSGAVQLFSGLGLEPYGRFGLGLLELLAALLLINPGTVKYGAVLGSVLMAGVVFIHITKLGIALNGDFSFFFMGLAAFICCISLAGKLWS